MNATNSLEVMASKVLTLNTTLSAFQGVDTLTGSAPLAASFTGSMLVLVDLDNTNADGSVGKYKHSPGAGVKMMWGKNVVTRHLSTGAFDVNNTCPGWGGGMGVIKSVNEDGAQLAQAHTFCINPNSYRYDSEWNRYPTPIDFTVSKGAPVSGFAGGFSNLTYTSLNTGTQIVNAFGDMVIPGVGDVVILLADFPQLIGFAANIAAGSFMIWASGWGYYVE